jgi:hypothetical protein
MQLENRTREVLFALSMTLPFIPSRLFLIIFFFSTIFCYSIQEIFHFQIQDNCNISLILVSHSKIPCVYNFQHSMKSVFSVHVYNSDMLHFSVWNWVPICMTDYISTFTWA